MKSWVGTNELVYCISYLRGARRVTFSIHGTDYGALPSFPYYNIATPHLERIYYPILLKFVECRFKREVQLTEFSFPDV
jgi:hypothetical protein